jgi:hypothetical protein
MVLGAVAVLATLASQWVAGCLADGRRAFTVMATFLSAFAVYEAALFSVSATLLGGTETYTAAIQGRIFAINAAAFVGLLVLSYLAISVGLVNRSMVALSMKEQHV